MAIVYIPTALRLFTDGTSEVILEGENVTEVVATEIIDNKAQSSNIYIAVAYINYISNCGRNKSGYPLSVEEYHWSGRKQACKY